VELEREIKQKTPFPNDETRAMVNILFTSGWLTEQLKYHFKPFGITPKQYNILRIVNGADKPMTTSEIRTRMLDKMSDATRLIDRMVLKGWITKEINAKDRRLVDVLISEKGKVLLQKILNINPTLLAKMEKLNTDECRQLNLLLDKLRG